MTATGAVNVSAEDNAGIYSNSKIVSSSITSSDGGAALAQGVVNSLLKADYSTSEGTRTIKFHCKSSFNDVEMFERANFSSSAISSAFSGFSAR